MSDRALWLEEWCPECWASPGSRCRRTRSSRNHREPAARLRVARGWRTRSCPTCRAQPGESCVSPAGRESSRPHLARLRPRRTELYPLEAVWHELERRGATVALVPFWGRAGRSGTTETITLSRVEDDALVDIER